jgi:folate-dependent phosphoribosylglycinamide formyltransferase PurN
MQLGILTFESPQADLVIHRILSHYPGQVRGIVRSDVTMKGKSGLAGLAFLARRTGLGFVLPKGAEILLSRAGGALSTLVGRRLPVPSLRQMATEHRIPILGVHDLNTPTTLATVREWECDLLVSVYMNQRIGRELIELPPSGVINVHSSLLPRYRGLFPPFWVLANGESETGVTVHWVDFSFDTGDILVQQRLAVQPLDTVNSLSWRSAALGADLVVRAIELVARGQAPHVPQDQKLASYHSWPTRADVRRLRARGHRYGSIFDVFRLGKILREPLHAVEPDVRPGTQPAEVRADPGSSPPLV